MLVSAESEGKSNSSLVVTVDEEEDEEDVVVVVVSIVDDDEACGFAVRVMDCEGDSTRFNSPSSSSSGTSWNDGPPVAVVGLMDITVESEGNVC